MFSIKNIVSKLTSDIEKFTNTFSEMTSHYAVKDFSDPNIKNFALRFTQNKTTQFNTLHSYLMKALLQVNKFHKEIVAVIDVSLAPSAPNYSYHATESAKSTLLLKQTPNIVSLQKLSDTFNSLLKTFLEQLHYVRDVRGVQLYIDGKYPTSIEACPKFVDEAGAVRNIPHYEEKIATVKKEFCEDVYPKLETCRVPSPTHSATSDDSSVASPARSDTEYSRLSQDPDSPSSVRGMRPTIGKYGSC